jgi:hypothetical protein
VQDPLEVRIAHAHVVHVVEGVPDVIDTRPALADALGDEARPAMQVELANVGGMTRIGDKRECSDPAASG